MSGLKRIKISLKQIGVKQVACKIFSNKFGLYLEMCYLCLNKNK